MPVLTAFENVELPLLLTSLARRERRERVRQRACRSWACPTAWTTTRTSCRAASSSAWRSRARSSPIPTLIVADEPTGDLDRETAEEILDLLERLNRELGKTIIMVTHDPKAAAARARMIHLEKGVLVD